MLVSSKLAVKTSSRAVNNKSSEATNAYSCQLFLDSFRIGYRGFIYFVWSSSQAQIQSLRYESQGRTVKVKETLTLSVRINSRNGRQAPQSSDLKLLAESGEVIDEYQISLNDLTGQFKEIEAPMNRGLVILRARRKLMSLGVEQEENLGFTRGLYRSKVARLDEKSFAGEYQSLQQELNRIRKELQDQSYLNNKLKNDRDVLLATKQELEMQIETLLMQMTKQVSKLREHYDNKLAIRQHSYEEEIEDLVNMFNSNADQTKKIIDNIMRQKIRLEEEVKPLHERIKVLEEKAAEDAQAHSTLQKENTSLLEKIGLLEKDLSEKEEQIEKMIHEQGELHGSIDTLRGTCVNLENNITVHQQTITQRDALASTLEGTIKELQEIISGRASRIQELEEEITRGRERQDAQQKEKQLAERQFLLRDEEKRKLEEQLENLQGRLEEYGYQMEFNENVIGQLKKQQAQKEEELYAQLQSMEALYNQKVEELQSAHDKEKDELASKQQTLMEEKNNLEGKVKQLESNVEGSELRATELDNQLVELNAQINEQQSSSQTKKQQLQALQQQIASLREANASLVSKISDIEKLDVKKQQPKLSKSGVDKLQKSHAIAKQKNTELEKKITTFQSENKGLKEELQKLKATIKKIEEEKVELEREVAQADRGSHRSLRSTRGRHSRQRVPSDDELSANTQIHEIVVQKEREISELRRRLDELQSLYRFMMVKIDKIVERYPQVDIQKIESQMPRVQEWCESQKEEEKVLNQLTQKAHIVTDKTVIIEQHEESLDRPDPPSRSRIPKTMSINQVIEEEDDGQVSGMLSERKISVGEPIGPSSRKKLGGSVIRREPSIYSPDKGDNRSDVSGVSYVKVSHTKKIKEMEELIKVLQQQKSDLQDVIAEMGHDPKQVLANASSRRSLGSGSKGSIKNPVIMEPARKEMVSRQSQVVMEDEKLKAAMAESNMYKLEIQKLQLKAGEAEEAMKVSRIETDHKVQGLQGRILESQRRVDELIKQIENLVDQNKHLQRQTADVEDRLRKQKQATQEAKLHGKELSLALDSANNQLKKLRSSNETLEEKVNKMAGSELTIRELSKEIDDLNKKALQQTRLMNHMRLEKDSLEEELRLLKKRHSDQTRIAGQWEEKAASLERAAEEARRREGRIKREVEEAQEETRRKALQVKKIQEEAQALSSAQVGWQAERRKHMDEISSLQDQLSRKDYEYTRQGKELQKWKMRAEERQEQRMGRKSQLREEIQRLQGELIRRDKRVLEQGEENKLLRGRLELLERENKRMLDQKNQTYGEKLRYYVEEMGSIKKLLEEYQNQNSRLKIDNNDLYEQSQELRLACDRLQNKYDEAIQRQENILTDLQAYISDNNSLRDRLNQASIDIEQTEAMVVSIRKQSDDIKVQNRKMADKLDQTERDLERIQAQERQMRVRVSEMETQMEINHKVGEKFRQSERRCAELQEECRKIKIELDNIINVYVYTREEMEKAVSDARNKQRRLKQEELSRLNEENSRVSATKSQRLQQEVLDVYNQNNRLRTEIQVLLDENSKQKRALIDLEAEVERVGPLQIEVQNCKNTIEQLKQEVSRKNERLIRAETASEGMMSEFNIKDREIKSVKTKVQQLETKISQLTQELQAKRQAERELQDNLSRAGSSLQRQKAEWQHLVKQKEMSVSQEFKTRIIELEGELQRARDKEHRMGEQNAAKMKSLEQKMDEMEEALGEREKAIESHYEAELQQLESSLLRLSEELDEKMARIEELNEAVIILEGQNKDLTTQLEQIRGQQQEERNTLQTQLNRLKTKVKEAEVAYATNLKTLEEQVARAHTQARQTTSNSRLKTVEDDRVTRRYEEKLKNKDRKIDQLKENIYTLEETIVRMKKKQQLYDGTTAQVQRINQTLTELQKEKRTIEIKFTDEVSQHNETIRLLKRDILEAKQNEERFKLQLEERNMEIESMSCELKTLKELYHELQRELEKRKNNLANQIEEESTLQLKLRTQQSRIIELEQQLLEATRAVKDMQLETKRKHTQLRKSNELIEELMIQLDKGKVEVTGLNKQLTTLKKNLLDETATSQSVKAELRVSRNELNRLRKNQEDLRSNCMSQEETMAEMKRINEELAFKWREAEDVTRRFAILNDRARHEIGCGVEELLDRLIRERQDHQEQIDQLVQECEQLKFLNERKFMDYDELKRQNLQLQIKAQDLEVLTEQLDALRKICDKLEEEKKNSSFREEVLRMQIENLAATTPELRHRIESILAAPDATASYGHHGSFSFY